MKQTALQWLLAQININGFQPKHIEQAIEMEKEQIRRAFCHGEVARDRIDSIEYYNETYGK